MAPDFEVEKHHDLTDEQLNEIAAVVSLKVDAFYGHQRELLKIKLAAFGVAAPIAVFVGCALLSIITTFIGSKPWHPDEWLVTLMGSLLTAAISQFAATLITIRQRSSTRPEEEKPVVLKVESEREDA